MSVTTRYRDVWEGFWRDAPEEPGSVIWDAEPSLTAERHLALFAPHVTDPALPGSAPDGRRIDLPAQWLVVGARPARP